MNEWLSIQTWFENVAVNVCGATKAGVNSTASCRLWLAKVDGLGNGTLVHVLSIAVGATAIVIKESRAQSHKSFRRLFRLLT